MMASKQVNVLFPDEQVARLEGLAGKMGLTVSSLVRLAAIEYLDNHEKGSAEMLFRWQGLVLLDIDMDEFTYELNPEEYALRMREFKETGSMSTVFFKRLGLSHENPDDASTWGPQNAADIDWAGFPGDEYERKDEWGGYKISKAPTGFVVSTWSARQGELTDAKYLLPYGAPLLQGYGRGSDLEAMHNEGMTVGAFVASRALDTPDKSVRVLRKGRIVR